MDSELELRLRQSLLPVFGFDSVDELSPEASLVKDAGADSLDFVELTYVVERDFGVALKTGELMSIGAGSDVEHHFVNGKLTAEGAEALNRQFPGKSSPFAVDMTKMALFEMITVRDLAKVIARIQNEKIPAC